MRKSHLASVRKIIAESGLWEEGRSESHGFILSPEVYRVSGDEHKQLKILGQSLYDVMSGFSRLVAFSENQKVAKGRTWDMIRRVARIGIPRTHRRVQVLTPEDYPLLFKVDLLKSGGRFWVMELDGTNTHGFGYTVLLNRIRDAVAGSIELRLGGVALTIANYMRAVYAGRPLFCFISGNSRFYEPYYRILAKELKRLGVEVVLTGEWMTGHEIIPQNVVALQFPIFRSESVLQRIFAEDYEQGRLKFLISPKTFMGSKSVLALLKNSYSDHQLEQILHEFINPSVLDVFRGFVPVTYLIYPDREGAAVSVLSDKSWLLKKAIASGMKGIEFIPNDQPLATRLKNEPPYQSILQEELENDPYSAQYYDDQGELQSYDRWFLRFTAHFSFAKLAELNITARRDKMVHGAKDCLMFSSVFS